jgi:hypothetical protein
MRGPFGENALGPAELVREREPDGLALRFGLPHARNKSIDDDCQPSPFILHRS